MSTSRRWAGSTVLPTGSLEDPRKGTSPGAGYETVHVAVADPSRLSCVEVLADEKGPTTVGFVSRAVAWSNE